MLVIVEADIQIRNSAVENCRRSVVTILSGIRRSIL